MVKLDKTDGLTGMARKMAKQSARRSEARDIGPLPPVENPERKASCEFDLLRFLQSYCSHRYPLPWSPDHFDFISDLQGTVLHGGTISIGMPRGSGKTTIIEDAATWALVYGHRKFLVVVAADDAAAGSIISTIKEQIADNELLCDDFPEACFPIKMLGGVSLRAMGQTIEGERTHVVWTADELRLPAQAAGGGSVVRGCGITGRIRGAKASLADGSQVRPDLILIDDFQTDQSAASPSQVAKRLRIIQSTILGLAGPGQKTACCAAVTIIQRHDGADQLLDRQLHPEWQGRKVNFMKSMPSESAMKLWDQYGDIYRADLRNDKVDKQEKRAGATAFYIKNRKAMDENAIAYWEGRHDKDEISAIQHAMDFIIDKGMEAFRSEYQNDPIDLAEQSDIEQLDSNKIQARVSGNKPGIAPSDAVKVTAAIDVSQHILWFLVAGWRQGLGGDIIEYGASPAPGRNYFTQSECAGSLEKMYPASSWADSLILALTDLCGRLLDREYQKENGDTVRIDRLAIDGQYGKSTDAIYEFCKRCRWPGRVIPFHGKGVLAKKAPMSEWGNIPGEMKGPDWRFRQMKNRQIKSLLCNVNAWKSHIADRLISPVELVTSIRLPGERPGANRMLGDHLSAEHRKRVTAEGRTVEEWEEIPNRDNHLFDCLDMSAVVASLEGISLGAGDKKLRRAPLKPGIRPVQISEAVKQTQQSQPPPRPRRSTNGWAGTVG